MKKIILNIVLLLCFMSAHGQTAVPDTVYIYETVTVYDTIVIRDTVRVRKATDMHVLQPKGIDTIISSLQPENIFPLFPATFSENDIILHENNKNHHQKNVNTMKLNIASKLSAVILTAQSMAGISAQETKPADMTTFPIQMSIVYPMTTQGDKTVNYRYNLSFNLFAGKTGAVTGVEFGTLFNHVERDVRGVQFGGLANRTHELTGVQFGGLGNAAGTVNGIQFGGLGNISEDVTGVQFGGIANITERANGVQFGGIANICKEAAGLQFAGIANLSEHTKGIQFGGIVNVTEKSEGVQFGGIGNVSKEVTGMQFGGIFNRTGTLRGVQFGGIVNITDTIEKGASIALINIVKKGYYRAWELSFADYRNVGVSFKMGTQKFYTILTAGANFVEDKLWIYGFGFGNRTALGPRVDFQPEITGYQYLPGNFKNIRNTTSNHLKLGFVFRLNDRLGLVVAPSVYYFYAENNENGEYYRISPVAPFYKKNVAESSHEVGDTGFRIPSHVFGFGAGISVGLVLK